MQLSYISGTLGKFKINSKFYSNWFYVSTYVRQKINSVGFCVLQLVLEFVYY